MSGNIEDDLFYDLFGEKGFLTPESTESSGSPDQDSGHDSPLFDASPDSFGWEMNDHVGELWGSLLDDIPSDITDDSDSNDHLPILYSANDDDSPLGSNHNEPLSLAWSSKLLEENTFDYNSNNMAIDSDWDLGGNSLNNIESAMNDASFPPTNVNHIFPVATMPITKLPVIDSRLLSTSIDTTAIGQSEIQQQSSPIIIKPVTPKNKNGPTWVVKSSDIKSHFKIGENIVAIIQQSYNNLVGKPDFHDTLINDLKIGKTCHSSIISKNDQGHAISNMKHMDHDYADKEEIITLGTMGVSQGIGPGLVLTDEEKKLLELESLNIPEDAPLTKEEEKVLKKVRRKIKNKQSAMESRRKRKEYIENLERRVKHCTDLNHGLRKKVDKLTKENKSLSSQLKNMKDFIAASFQQNRTASTGTCLAVLLLSFALFILPFNPYNEEKSSLTESPNPTAMFRSRTLLNFDDNSDFIYHDNELSNISFYSTYTYVYDSISNESHVYTDNVKLHFEKYAVKESDYVLKANVSTMYMNHNITLHSVLDNKRIDQYLY